MKKIDLNGAWQFCKLPEMSLDQVIGTCSADGAVTVDVPHTWHTDADPYRGLALYEKTIARDKAWKKLFISFDGADQHCRVYVNGFLAGEHKGAYARFTLPVPQEAMQQDTLTIRVFLQNVLNEELPPFFGDFTIFGGLYRNVSLLCAEETHFDRCYWGTEGVIIRTAVLPDGSGVLSAEPHTVGADADAQIRYILWDDTGRRTAVALLPAAETAHLQLAQPALWNGRQNRAFYTLTAELEQNGQVMDTVSIRTGFRSLTFTGEGAALNGQPIRLHGVAKHQDIGSSYSAVTDQQIDRDFELIREIGANAVRLSHYQHSQHTYDRCDEDGLLCWAEIPMLKMTESPALLENTKQQLTELILQNIHHPSIFCWGIQNEIAMFMDAPFMHDACAQLHELVKELDPDRCSAAANLYPLRCSSRLNEITDLVGYNLYFGWYYHQMQDFGPWLDKMHSVRPALPFGVTEYGADANLALHSDTPHVKDYTEEFQALWHETVYPQIESRDWIWGSFVWNMFDFSSARRDEGGVKFVNAKGLVSGDRQIRKDAFYYYKARWSDVPFVHLCGSRYVNRAGESTAIKVYTNQQAVSLRVNGVLLPEKHTANGTAEFTNVLLTPGENHIEAIAGGLSDNMLICRVSEPDAAYRLPGEEDGAVRNWFLQEDDYRCEGSYSIMYTAGDLLENPDTRRVLEKYVPGLVKFMTEKKLIPLGLIMKNILDREAKNSGLDLKAINAELNQIPDDRP